MNKRILPLLITILFALSSSAQTFHINENFNGGSLPAGWANTAVTGSNAWNFGLDGSVDHAGANNLDGSSFAYFDDSQLGVGSLNNKASLVTPAFNNLANGATILEFDYNFRQYGTNVPDSFIVEVFDGTSWNLVFSRDVDDLGNYLSFTTFPRASVDISAFKNAACKVRFVYFDGNDWGWYVGLDNISIFSPLADDIGASNITAPVSTCGLSATDTVKVMIVNYGANAATGFPITYVINGGTPVTETVNLSVPVNDSLEYTFTTTSNFSTPGTYNIEAYTSYVLDGNQPNDSTLATVENQAAFAPNYFEGFETGLGGWTIEGTNSSWARGIPSSPNIGNAAGGVNAMVTNLSGVYNNNENSRLVSPCLDFSALTADPELRFSLNYRTENPFDRTWIEYSTDEGLTWSKVLAAAGSTNWYNNTGQNVWSGNSNGWVNVKNKLTGTAGFGKVLIRFVFASDGSVTFDGVGIDNVAIIGPQAVDIEAFSLIDPVASAPCGFGSSQQVTLRVFNNGQNPITTFDAGYRVNNNTPILQNGIVPASPIAPGSFYNHTFTQTSNLSLPGFYSIDLWAEVAGDNFVPNDSLNNVAVNNASRPISFFSDFENDVSNGNAAITTTTDGWVQTNPSNTVNWRVDEGGTPSFATGPTVDHTTGTATGNYVYIETSTGNSPNPAQLVSPCLNLGNNQGANLSFWYHMHGATIGTLEVEVFDGSSWTSVRTITGQQQTGQTDAWLEDIVSLSAYAGSSIQLRFSANRTTSFTGDIAIDDILVFEPIPQDAQMGNFLAPTEGCGLTSNSPVTVEVENFGTTTIPADSVYLYYQVDNLPPVKDTLNTAIALGAQVIHTFTTGPNLSNSGQTYRLKAWCELNGDSNIGNDTTYLTVKNNVKSLPFNENFTSFNGQNNNNGWEFNPSTTTGVYWSSTTGSTPSTNTGPNGDHTTGNGRYVFLETSGSGGPAFLISPCIDLTNVSGAVLNFWYHKFGTGMNDLFVDVYDNNLGVWINNIGVVRGQTQTASSDAWKEAFVNISQYAGKQINFRFRGLDGTAGFTGDMAVDDILIFEPIPQDAKVDSLNSPESGCDLTPNELVCVEIENFGTQDITAIKAGYSINNGPPVYDSAVGILIIPGAKLTFCFNTQRANLSAPGNYDFKIWTDLTGDTNEENDTLFQTVVNETILFPDCDDFEGVTDVVGEGGPDLLDGKFSNNWVSNQGDYTWEFGARPSNPGPANDHSPTGLGRYMVVDNANGQNGDMAVLTSPCYDLTTVAVANLEFWYHQYGSVNNRMYIDVFDGQLWQNNVDSVIGSPQANRNAAWRLKRVSLANYTGNFVNVRFRTFRLGGTYTIDDVCMVPPPANQAQMIRIIRPLDQQCFYSNNEKVRMVLRNIGSNAIDSLEVRVRVDTNTNPAATAFSSYFDTTVWAYPGANPPSWDPGDLYTFETPYGVDLSRYKTYRIRTDLILNGDLDPSDDFVANYRVKHQDPIRFPHIDGFETLQCNANPNNNVFANDFRRSGGTYRWVAKCGPDRIGLTGPSRDNTRKNNFGRYMVTQANVGQLADIALLETPCFDMSTLNKPTFRFWYHMFGFQMGVLYIDINADNGWVTLDSILGQQQINNASPWLQRSIDLGAYAGTYAKVRFRSVRGDGAASDMAIDDIFVFDLSQYDIGPTDVVRPGSDNFACYSDTQSVHVNLLNYGARTLDFTVDTMTVTVEVLKDGVPYDTLFRELNSNIYNDFTRGPNSPLPNDSTLRVWVNNSSDGNSTFDMSTLGSTYTFNVSTSMKRDSVDNNDVYTENITTQIAGGTVAISNNSICNGTVVRLNATGFFGAPKWERKYFGPNGTSFWLPEFGFGSDSAEYVVQPDTSAWYRVRICGSNVVSDSVKIDVTVVKTPRGIHDTICGGGQMTVEAFADPIHNLQSVNWYNNQDDTLPFLITNSVPHTLTRTYLETDTFWLEGVIDSCVSLSRNPVYAVVNPFPVVDLGLLNDTVCQDTNRILNAGAGFGYTYNWQITGPNNYNVSSDLQVVGVNPLDLEKDETYNYRVTVTSEFGCATISDLVSIHISDSCFVGINPNLSIIENNLVVYPNPTNSDIFINLSGYFADDLNIQILSVDGKLIWEENNVAINSEEYKIDLGEISEGVYFIKINSENESVVRKLIKN